jgi:hypothetical protein
MGIFHFPTIAICPPATPKPASLSALCRRRDMKQPSLANASEPPKTGIEKIPGYRGLLAPTPFPGEDRKIFHPTTKAGYVRPARKNYNILKQ